MMKLKTMTPEEIAAREPKEKSVDVETLLKRAGVGKRFIGETLLSYKPKNDTQGDAIQACFNYCEKNMAKGGRGLILIGKPNTGKTHLLTGIMRYYLNSGMRCRYTTVEDFFFALQSTFNSKDIRELDVINGMIEPQLLVLDDLQSLKNQDDAWQYRRLWYLLDKRYADCKATLVSTNKTLSGFKEMIDERTGRRLQAEVIALD